MKKMVTTTDTGVGTDEQSAQWYRAATLIERLTLVPRDQFRRSADPAKSGGNQQAEQRFKQWKNQPPFQRLPQLFTQRLEMDGLTEDELLSLLAQPAEEIQAAYTTPPAWLTAFLEAFASQEMSPRFDPLFQKITNLQTLAFLQPVRPLLERGFKRLQEGIKELRASYTRLPFDPDTVESLLFPRLFSLFLPKLIKVFVLELNVARIQGKLEGETPEQRFNFFLQQLAQPEKALALFEEYPVLARQLVETTECWLNCELEFLQRLCADWDEIRSTFSPESDPGLLSRVREGDGDTHNGGHSVATLTWSSGLQLLYKPRSLAIDVHLQETLDWLNTRGFQPALRTFKLLHKDGYGWCEFVAVRPCGSPEEVERFYRRLGGQLTLLYALEATDFHAQNLIAAGEEPMLIDLEALLHPRFPVELDTPDPGEDLLDQCVLRIGLLPQRLWADQQNNGVDLSGLTGQDGQLTPDKVAQLKEKGTDQMRITKERVELERGSHRPKLQEQDVDTLAYGQSIVSGFTAAYRLLLQHREELLQTILPRFAQDEVRVLARATRLYAALLADSSHPSVLRDGLELERLIDRLWISVELQPYLARAISAERADLLLGDIPKFTTRPNSRDLFTSRGESIPAFFTESSLDAARRRIEELSEEDLERQVWIIRASLTSATTENHSGKRDGLQLRPADSLPTRERLIDEALAIGRRMQQLACAHEERVNWLGLMEGNAQQWHIMPTGPDLYNGLSGIALFLAYLGQLSGEEQFTRLARSAWQNIRALAMREKRYLRWGLTGAFDGVGSLIYLLSHLGTLWRDPALYQEAEEIVAHVPEMIATDQLFDVVGGSAGCLAALLSLYAVAPGAAVLAAAIQCGDFLLSQARTMPQGIGWSKQPEQVPLTGMAHGNAGIALNLLRLAAVSKEERFQQAARAALAYERKMFLPEKHNWADLRGVSEIPDNAQIAPKRPAMVAWCHGAAGIGLARLEALRYLDDATTREEIAVAVSTTLAGGFGASHALCHGDMGNLETLLTASLLLPDLCPKEKVEALQASLLQSMQEQGWQSSAPRGTETPGLMHGLAGTGYMLLRQAAPERVPSLLALAPPRPLER